MGENRKNTAFDTYTEYINEFYHLMLETVTLFHTHTPSNEGTQLRGFLGKLLPHLPLLVQQQTNKYW